MNAPLIWIVFPFIGSFLLLLLNKQYRLVCIIQSFMSALLGLLIFFIPITQPGMIPASGFQITSDLIFLGRSISIANHDRLLVGIYYGFLFIWTISIIILNENSRIVPLGMAFVSLLITATSVSPFLYAALIIEIAVVLCVIMIHDQKDHQSRGISRFLIFMTMGMSFILLSGWYLAGGELSPVNETQLMQATVLLGLGFIFWLAVFPFYSWIPVIFEENQPINTAFVLIILPIAVLNLMIRFLDGFSWLRNSNFVFQTLSYLGGVMVATGGLWALFQTKIRRILGFVFFISNGALLISLGLNNVSGYFLFSYQILPRMIGFALFSWSIIWLEKKYGEGFDLFSTNSAIFELPYSSVGLLIAIFSLAGMPLLASFPVIQTIYQQLASRSLFLVGMFVLGNGCISVVGFRLLSVMLSNNNQFGKPDESRNYKILILLCVVLIFAIGSFPQFFLNGFGYFIQGFENLVK